MLLVKETLTVTVSNSVGLKYFNLIYSLNSL